nr:hypothetical protein [Paenibacillus sp. AR247]
MNATITAASRSGTGKRAVFKGLAGFGKLILLAYAVVTLYPLYWLFTSAFKTTRISLPIRTGCRNSGWCKTW